MLQLDFRKKKNGVPILSQLEIDNIAEGLLMDYDPKLLKEPTSLDIELFSETYAELEMDYKDLTPDQSTLGATVFTDGEMPVYDMKRGKWDTVTVEEGTVIIDNSLLNPDQLRRGRFTLGHEIGHWLFHRHMFVVDKNQLTLFDSVPPKKESYIKCRSSDIENPGGKIKTDDDWMERHADYFAAALLMPKTTFKKAVQKMFMQVGLLDSHYRLGTDHDLDLWALFLPRDLADIFDVSTAAARIRLKKLGAIIEPKSGPQLLFDNTV